MLPESILEDVEDEDDVGQLRKRLAESEKREPPAGGVAWVAKASNANRGESLFLARTAEEAADLVGKAALEGGVVEWVVQRYVTPPLLVGGRKFHVRAHFLLSGCPRCGTTRAWLHGEHHLVLVR